MHVATLPEQLFPMALNWIDASGSEQLLGPKARQIVVMIIHDS